MCFKPLGVLAVVGGRGEGAFVLSKFQEWYVKH